MISSRRTPIKSSELRSPERPSESRDSSGIILFPDKSYFGGASLARGEGDKIRCAFHCQRADEAQRARALMTVGRDGLEGFVLGQRKSWRVRKTDL